ncbi:hypothetical protein ACIGXM_29615 [Kitasatospora sp. NPDC052896]
MKKIIQATLFSALLVLSVVSAAPALQAPVATPAPQAAQEQTLSNWAWD